jgi:hypothetical protein
VGYSKCLKDYCKVGSEFVIIHACTCTNIESFSICVRVAACGGVHVCRTLGPPHTSKDTDVLEYWFAQEVCLWLTLRLNGLAGVMSSGDAMVPLARLAFIGIAEPN